MNERTQIPNCCLLFTVFVSYLLTAGLASAQYGYPVTPYQPGSYAGRSFFYDRVHLGEDEQEPEETPIVSIGPGVVKFYGPATGYGELVVAVQHDLGAPHTFTNAYGEAVSTRYILSIYGHLRASRYRGGAGTGLVVGSTVSAGTIIGYVNDGAHNGDGTEHVHVGVRLSDDVTAKARDGSYWLRGYNTNVGTACGSQCAADFSAASSVLTILTGTGLFKLSSSDTVHWLQNDRRYPVVSETVLTIMQSANIPGWSWSQISTVTSLRGTVAPNFINADSSSNGLLIRQLGTTTVYLLQNGRRRAFVSEEALTWNGTNWFGDVIDVAPAILSSPYSDGSGADVYGVGEGGSDTVKAAFKSAYSRLMGSCGSTTWSGWPGQFATCLEFPQSAVLDAAVSGTTGSSGKYQNFGNDTTRLGVLEYSPSGTYGVWGAIFTKWQSLGYSASSLGFPTSDEYQWGTYRRSDFEGGYIYWSQSTGAIVVYNSVATRIMSLSGSLAFGDVTVGMTATRTLTIGNTGNATLTVSSISYPNGFSGA
jgi:murein DD-endopeptidase MepM/ murein hydrolase activator NlpD